MVFERRHWIIVGSVGIALSIAVIVGVTVGVVAGRHKSEQKTNEQRARDILTQNPLIDGHNDWASVIRAILRNNISDHDLYNMTQYDRKNNTPSQTDITRLRKGLVGGQFWSIYTSCVHQGKDAIISFMEQIDLMNRIIEKYSDVFQLVKTADEIRQAFQAKRIASLFGVEGGQSIESTFSILRLFYQMGVRYMTLTHNCNTPWADQNQVDRANSILIKNNGLTEFGKKIITEMNRLGMLIDLSHVSKKTMLDVLNITRSPVIFSHSSAWALCNHSRNVQDDVLQLIKSNRGIVMVAFTPGFITCNNEYTVKIPDVAEHINYVRNVAGIDSVGIGADYDGIDETPEGLEDVSTYPKIIEYLISQGNWTDDDIIKLIGGNILRVIEENEKIARDLQKIMKPFEDLIPRDDLIKYNLTQCRYLDMYTDKSNQ
ncbi:unnamed protein product [Rotaria sp. Silwood2]|nr:unnamed protein product [Rotaria sp. Silwood2]CAF2576890.1 unnamed protein product [Rotaria sp. Silwood2]CAF2824261.1 unnamed protein product [Rotaria sp. Silwood2]CAF2985183.1 unnamed protein product [Rotaria sp. Silwood2]CAF3875382.1 unnamed protein product [Rotaria sp. Silwood2]